MSYIGTNNVGEMYLGATKIGKAYLGSDLVYSVGGEVVLPYDAEVEYLHSDGNAYIDTGINADGGLSIECEYKLDDNVNKALAGAIYDRGNGNYYRHHLSPFNSAAYYYGANTLAAPYAYANVLYHLILDTINGVVTTNNNAVNFTPSNFDCQCNYYLFARNSSSIALQSRAASIMYFKMSRNGVLVRNFIPVRVGQVGYMYDTVSRQLFGNIGSSSFTFGNDKTT